ncbi:MAG: amidase, partial [Dehalococcoidia bacterium]
MSSDRDLAFTPATELAALVARGEVSPVELTELTLRRIDEFNPTLHAYLTVTADDALAAAAEAEQAVMRGDELGPLHGVPIPIKDLVPTKGVRTTMGSAAFSDWTPEEDDITVRRIKAAGAVIVGKSNTPEFGHLGITKNRLGENCRNPWDPERESGGSSGGAAASVAAGITSIAQGGDGGGSIRIPCSLCGLYGIKGTEGRVPRSDSGALGGWHPYNLAQTGPLSRTVRDSALLLQVLAGPSEEAQPGAIQTPPPDFLAALDDGVQGLRIGWTPDMAGAVVDPEVATATERAARAFEGLGARVDPFIFEVDRAELDHAFKKYFDLKAYERWGSLLRDSPDLLTDYVREGMEYAA